MTKTKIVGLDELCNLCVHHFLIWNYLVPQIFVRSLNILKFKFQTIETKSYEEITKTKLVDLDTLYNFVSDIVSIFNRLLAKKSIWSPNTTKTVTDIVDPLRQDKNVAKFSKLHLTLSRVDSLADTWAPTTPPAQGIQVPPAALSSCPWVRPRGNPQSPSPPSTHRHAAATPLTTTPLATHHQPPLRYHHPARHSPLPPHLPPPLLLMGPGSRSSVR